MHRGRLRQGPVVGLAAVVLAVLVAQIALAGSSGTGEPRATSSAVTTSKFKKLKKQVAGLQAQVDQLVKQPGQQGPQGPAGSAPACQGNGSGDTMVAAGAVCIDKYEVSIWTAAEGGTQITGAIPAPCTDNGQDCDNIFARSVPTVTPRASITWFQAQAALANVGKRLPSNAEWQQAVAGTQDPGPDNGTTDCRTTGGSAVNTGSRSACVSNFGANDMVGNLYEWVADWVPSSTACPGWSTFSNDEMCLSGASATATGPGALLRGGDFLNGAGAGPFTVFGSFPPPFSDINIGFRGAR